MKFTSSSSTPCAIDNVMSEFTLLTDSIFNGQTPFTPKIHSICNLNYELDSVDKQANGMRPKLDSPEGFSSMTNHVKRENKALLPLSLLCTKM